MNTTTTSPPSHWKGTFVNRTHARNVLARTASLGCLALLFIPAALAGVLWINDAPVLAYAWLFGGAGVISAVFTGTIGELIDTLNPLLPGEVKRVSTTPMILVLTLYFGLTMSTISLGQTYETGAQILLFHMWIAIASLAGFFFLSLFTMHQTRRTIAKTWKTRHWLPAWQWEETNRMVEEIYTMAENTCAYIHGTQPEGAADPVDWVALARWLSQSGHSYEELKELYDSLKKAPPGLQRLIFSHFFLKKED